MAMGPVAMEGRRSVSRLSNALQLEAKVPYYQVDVVRLRANRFGGYAVGTPGLANTHQPLE